MYFTPLLLRTSSVSLSSFFRASFGRQHQCTTSIFPVDFSHTKWYLRFLRNDVTLANAEDSFVKNEFLYCKNFYFLYRGIGEEIKEICEKDKGGGLSDHFLVEARLKLLGGWRSAGRMEGMRNVLKVSERNHSDKERAYQESLRGKYEVWRGGEVESVEKEWEKFRDIVMECTIDVCGMRRVGGQRRVNDMIFTKRYFGTKKWVRRWPKKRGASEEWLQRRDRVTYDRDRAQRVVVKQAVQASK